MRLLPFAQLGPKTALVAPLQQRITLQPDQLKEESVELWLQRPDGQELAVDAAVHVIVRCAAVLQFTGTLVLVGAGLNLSSFSRSERVFSS